MVTPPNNIAAAIASMHAASLSIPPDSPRRSEPTPEPEKPAAFRALLNATDGIVRQVVELHEPTFRSWVWRCGGCDPGDYAASYAEWPCGTIELIAEQLGVSLREDDYTVDAG